jgi:hypothetical protein
VGGVLMVDSAGPVDEAFLSAVEALCCQKPIVWGRYLTDGHGAATPLTADEAAVLHAAGIAVLLYANNATSTSVGGTDGRADAAEAIAAARALGIPAGTLLVADLEYGWPVAQAWLQGWCGAIRAADYAAGFYGCLAQPYLRLPFTNALKGGMAAPALVSASWTAGPADFEGARLPAWAPEFATPETRAMIAGWQATGGQQVQGGPVDLGVWDAPLSQLWSGKSAAAPARSPSLTLPPVVPIGGSVPAAAPEPVAATVTGAPSASGPSLSVSQAFAALQQALRAAGLIQ